MTSLEHDVLKADLDAAARALGIQLTSDQHSETGADGRVMRARVIEAHLSRASPVCARFVREGWLNRAKKLFVEEVETGVAWFDDHVFVVTSTPAQTAQLLSERRVQVALTLLVDDSRCVEIEGTIVRVRDEDAPDDGRDASAELLALAAHVLSLQAT